MDKQKLISILIVHDILMTRQMLKIFLETAMTKPFEVAFAKYLPEAKQKISNQDFDLIIVSLESSRDYEEEFIKWIRSLEQRPLIVAWANEKKEGFDHFLKKGDTFVQIKKLVTELYPEEK